MEAALGFQLDADLATPPITGVVWHQACQCCEVRLQVAWRVPSVPPENNQHGRSETHVLRLYHADGSDEARSGVPGSFAAAVGPSGVQGLAIHFVGFCFPSWLGAQSVSVC